jgi:predicted RNase H-like HicB family nuclease/DNA-binding Xre family transcriptional regulator
MEQLKILRAERGLTLRELEERTGISKDSISEIERGLRQPRASTVVKLAEGLGVDPAELLQRIAQPPARRPEPVEAAGGAFTAIYELTEDGWWVVSVPEIPGAHSQGETLEEARMMIRDAVRMLLEVRREDAERETEGKKNVVREPLEV